LKGTTLHSELQRSLVQLGNDLGFLARMEFPLENLVPGYSPIIDVVWFYPLSKSQSRAIKKTYDLWPYWEGSTTLYPYAASEITSLDVTSKTVMSEIFYVLDKHLPILTLEKWLTKYDYLLKWNIMKYN